MTFYRMPQLVRLIRIPLCSLGYLVKHKKQNSFGSRCTMCTLDTHIALNPKLADTGKQLKILLYQGHQEFPPEYVMKKEPNCMVSHSFSAIFSY